MAPGKYLARRMKFDHQGIADLARAKQRNGRVGREVGAYPGF